jgi:hypothetical protein
MKYPNIKKGIRWCCIVGGGVGLLWFGFACWLSTFPSEISPRFMLKPMWAAFQPWWSNWKSALILALLTGLPVGILAAFRPDFTDTKQKEKK